MNNPGLYRTTQRNFTTKSELKLNALNGINRGYFIKHAFKERKIETTNKDVIIFIIFPIKFQVHGKLEVVFRNY